MNKRKFQVVKAIACAAAIIFLFGLNACIDSNVKSTETEATENDNLIICAPPTERQSIYLTDEEIDLIALVTMAEAEGETVLGRRLVIDTILNRVDSDGFPNTVSEVIFQPNAFESVWNGRINSCYVVSHIRSLVVEETYSRTNLDCVYFSAGDYSDFGTPLFKEGNHYFSGE